MIATKTITGVNASSLYTDALQAAQLGRKVTARGMDTLELLDVELVLLDASSNLIVNNTRHLNYAFMLAEWLWIMTGCALKDAIFPFNRKLLMSVGEHDHTFTGAYGPKWIEQLPFILDALKSDDHSRQAVVNIWRDRPRASADTPCTLSWQFLIRDELLHMITTMRSNDVWLGTPYDLFSFTMIQQWLAAQLGVKAGSYAHRVGSFHAYVRDLPRLDQAACDRSPLPSNFPPMLKHSSPSLAIMQNLLLDAARIVSTIHSETYSATDVEIWVATWEQRLSAYGSFWWTAPAVLLSGNREWRTRMLQDNHFSSSPWQSIFEGYDAR